MQGKFLLKLRNLVFDLCTLSLLRIRKYANVLTSHAVGRYNAAAMFRIIEVLLGRVGVEEGFGGSAGWSLDIAGPAPEYESTNSSSAQ